MGWKIRNGKGLYSTGGSSPGFTKIGKTWNSLGHLKGHLTSYLAAQQRWAAYRNGAKHDEPAIPADWEVVETKEVIIATAAAALVPEERCANCKHPKKEHARKTGKCLFDNGFFKLWVPQE